MEQKGRGIARFAQVLAACATIAGPAVAGAQIAWTNWTTFTVGAPGAAAGSITTSTGTIGVTYTGEVQSGSQTSSGGGTQYFNPNNGTHNFPTGTYENGTTVPNGPGTNPGFVKLIGGNQVNNTLTFDTPVNNLFFSIISMGQGGVPVSYTFNNSFTIATQGTGWWGTCSTPPCLTQTGNVLHGTEGDGTLIFNGPISSISWTSAPAEDWHGFTVGTTTTTPEPSSMALLGTGLIGLVPMIRRRRK